MGDLTCRELIEFLDEYVSDALNAERRATFEAHLSECRDCRNYLAAYRAAMRLSHEAAEATAEDMPDDLVRAILAARTEGRTH
jgi:anti-sigma factor RsiW